jgi:hypothetical protein
VKWNQTENLVERLKKSKHSSLIHFNFKITNIPDLIDKIPFQLFQIRHCTAAISLCF